MSTLYNFEQPHSHFSAERQAGFTDTPFISTDIPSLLSLISCIGRYRVV